MQCKVIITRHVTEEVSHGPRGEHSDPLEEVRAIFVQRSGLGKMKDPSEIEDEEQRKLWVTWYCPPAVGALRI